ncbi:MAG: carboxynorspermidine decarboxylase [Clostridiales bacterium]|nr:carboxynorspermidine decarboxylase [Clostridiales bacterium]
MKNATFKTPYYLIDEAALIHNLEILRHVKNATGCKILLAQKAYSIYQTYPLIAKYLDGTTASGLHEATLGNSEFGGETHVYSAAYPPDDFDEIAGLCNHIVFNSFSQLRNFKPRLTSNNSVGIRVNPEISTGEHEIYDPCAKKSRLGVTIDTFIEEVTSHPDALRCIDGLHFHTLCEQNSDALAVTLKVIEDKFGKYIPQLKWVNFGGGHLITRKDYDIELLVRLINGFKAKYNVQVYLEPGEAIALNAGWLVASVLDIIKNDGEIAILDTSAPCHMPDVIEMPYTPNVVSGGKVGVKKFDYRLCGNSCLAGDIIGDYSFDEKLKVGDEVIFEDMAIYTMVKNNTFNGMHLPNILLKKISGEIVPLKTFGYEDFKGRL